MSWWRNLWRIRSADSELDAELRFHVERRVQHYVDEGLSADEARRRARIEFGPLDLAKEECRDVRPLRWLHELIRDVRLGFRTLGRDRFFAAAVTIILTLGIGTSVAMFSVLNAIVLRPLPYSRPGELARLTTHLIDRNVPDGTSLPNVLDWRQQSASFAGMTFYRRTSASAVTFAGIDAPQRAQEGLVGPEFFDLLGTPPLVGRTFSRAEFDGAEPVVVLSEGLWQDQFGRSEAALGRTLSIDGRNHTVIGVMPRRFQLPTRDTRFWRPLSLVSWWASVGPARASDGLEVIGRLAPGVRLEDAQAELGVIAGRLREAYAANRNLDVRITPLIDHVVGRRSQRGVWIGFAAVMSLLAIACANAGGLLAARAVQKRREIAVRAALGAGRARLIRHLLAESISLWVVASIAGVLLAYALIRLLIVKGPLALPRMDEVSLDAAGLLVAFLGGLTVVIACGLVPALVAAKADAAVAFGTRSQSGPPRQRLQDLLVTAQIAGAMLLVVGAVLLARSFVRAQNEDPGYPSKNLIIVRLDLPRTTYPERLHLAAFFRDARDRIGKLPGVVAVGGITDFFIRRNADQWVTVEGRPVEREAGTRLAIEGVTPGYFRGVGIEIVEGRDFDERDYEPGAPGVFIVGETLARRFWPDESAVGKRLVGGALPPKDGRWSTVVGVARDMRREGLDVRPILLAFIPSYLRGMDMTIHASTGAESLIPAVRQEIRAIDPTLPVTQIFTAEGRLSERLGGRRFEAQVLGVFAAIAVLLSAAGLYSLLAYQVALRTREIGIRSAIGADRRAIVRMVLEKGLRLAVVGAAFGLVGSVSSARVLQSLLYETAAVSPPSYAVAVVLVLTIAVTASWLPARRAAGVSPMVALRDE